MGLRQASQSLSRPPPPQTKLCTCAGIGGRTLQLMCLLFGSMLLLFINFCLLTHLITGLKELSLQVCQCQPAPSQLMNQGFFACAPTYPSLAVDLKLLKFTRLQFITMSPNVTGWCKATEMFLKTLSFKLPSKVCILIALHTTGWLTPTTGLPTAAIWQHSTIRLGREEDARCH